MASSPCQTKSFGPLSREVLRKGAVVAKELSRRRIIQRCTENCLYWLRIVVPMQASSRNFRRNKVCLELAVEPSAVRGRLRMIEDNCGLSKPGETVPTSPVGRTVMCVKFGKEMPGLDRIP